MQESGTQGTNSQYGADQREGDCATEKEESGAAVPGSDFVFEAPAAFLKKKKHHPLFSIFIGAGAQNAA